MSYRNYISGNKGIVFYPSTSIFLLEIRVIDWLFKNFSHGENLVDSKVGPKSTIITLQLREVKLQRAEALREKTRRRPCK